MGIMNNEGHDPQGFGNTAAYRSKPDKAIAARINTIIPGVAECADFGPAYNGEDYVTLTFRVPKDTPAIVGKWDLIPRGLGTFDWAVQKNPVED